MTVTRVSGAYEPYHVVFREGLETAFAPFGGGVGPTEMKNCWLSTKIGRIEPMPGTTKINSGVSIGSTILKYLAYGTTTDGESMVSVWGAGNVWRVKRNGAETLIHSGLNASAIPCIIPCNGVMIGCNGIDPPFEYPILETGAVAATTIGSDRPDVSTGFSATVTATVGNVKRVVGYYVSELNAQNEESALSELIAEVDASTGFQVTVGVTFPSGSGTKKLRVYRTEGDQGSPFFVEQLSGAAGATQNYTDDTLDQDLGDPIELHGDPPPSEIVCWTKLGNRVVGITAAGDLYWSDPDAFSSFFVLGNHISVSKDDGDVAVGVYSDTLGLIVVKEHHIYRVAGLVPSDFDVSPITSNDPAVRALGAPNQRAFSPVPGGFAFYYDGAAYLFRSGAISEISQPVNDIFEQISEEDGDSISVSYHTRKKMILFSIRLESDSGNGPVSIYAYNLKNKRWEGPYTLAIWRAMSVDDENGDAQVWGVGGSSVRYIWDPTTNEIEGSGFNTDVRTPFVIGRDFASLKFCKFVQITQRLGASSGSVRVRVLDDSGNELGNELIETGPTGKVVENIPVREHARSFQVRLTSTTDDANPNWGIERVSFYLKNRGHTQGRFPQ